MTIILSLALILAAGLNLLSLRRKRERLQIFNQTTEQKKSFLALLESQLDEHRLSAKESFQQRFIGGAQNNYYLLFNNSSSNNKLKTVMTAILGVVAGICVNYLYLNLSYYVVMPASFGTAICVLVLLKKKKLKAHFYGVFPEALSTIIGLVTSGSSISIAFNECAIKMEGQVAFTMKEMCSRLDVGENAENVLLGSYRQLPFPEYYFFILTIMVNLDGGGELKDVLSRLSKMLANNRMLAKNRDSKTAELRMSILILAILPFAFIFLLKLISPENYDYLMNTEGGNYILYYVVASVAIGVLFIKRMISKVV